LAQLHQRLQTTVVYVTHDQVEAMTLADRITIMNGGQLQQVGTPMEVFNTPRNRFVAGFIGSPSMNFFPVTREGKRGLKGEGFSIELNGDIPGDEETLELGVRPQALSVDAVGEASDLWKVKVNVVERLGPETYVYFKAGNEVATARLAPDVEVTPGETIALRIDINNVHVFDGKGDAILHTATVENSEN
jgi:multiple sugar transport system ATP-binding protein